MIFFGVFFIWERNKSAAEDVRRFSANGFAFNGSVCEISAQGRFGQWCFVRKVIFMIIFDFEINVITVYLYQRFFFRVCKKLAVVIECGSVC